MSVLGYKHNISNTQANTHNLKVITTIITIMIITTLIIII